MGAREEAVPSATVDRVSNGLPGTLRSPFPSIEDRSDREKTAETVKTAVFRGRERSTWGRGGDGVDRTVPRVFRTAREGGSRWRT